MRDRPQAPQSISNRLGSPPESRDGVPADLRQRFVRFRRANAPGTRIPADLRRAVLHAVQQGTSIRTLQRELGLTARQLGIWRRSISPASSREVARVFEVADSPVVHKDATSSDGGEGALELRLGPWSVLIRPTRA
jgi:hypothetical protein